MKWVNALGLLLQFVSFWLAAPEILGDSGLKRMQNLIKNLISNMSVILLSLLVLSYALFFAINGVLKGMEASSSGITEGEMTRYYIVLAAAMLLYLFFMIRFKRIRNWIDVSIAAPLLDKYIHNDRLRRNSLISGALLFTIGFLMQFIIIIAGP